MCSRRITHPGPHPVSPARHCMHGDTVGLRGCCTSVTKLFYCNQPQAVCFSCCETFSKSTPTILLVSQAVMKLNADKSGASVFDQHLRSVITSCLSIPATESGAAV